MTNLFMVKSFSPFLRCVPTGEVGAAQHIPQKVFVEFIDGLNTALTITPVLQATFVTGGLLMSVPILPIQFAGGGIQAASVALSAGSSWYRVRKYVKEANEGIFAPRGLSVAVVNTKQMIEVVGLDEFDKGKLRLPPFPEQAIERFHSMNADTQEWTPSQATDEAPYLRRLRALDGKVSELSFDVGEHPAAKSKVTKITTAPIRWANERDIKAQKKQRKKWLRAQEENLSEKTDQLLNLNSEIARLQSETQDQSVVLQLQATLSRRDELIEDILSGGQKKLKKVNKREENVANRVLWIVIKPFKSTSSV